MEAILGAIASEKIKNVVPRVVISNKFMEQAYALHQKNLEFQPRSYLTPVRGMEL